MPGLYYIKTLPDLLFEPIGKKLIRFLPDDRIAKLDIFKVKADWQRSLLGDCIIRAKIMEQIGIPANEIKLSANKHGKPYCINSPNLHFNMSHSGDFVVVLFGNKPVGVDVEKVKSSKEAVAKRFFTKDENDWLDAKNVKEKQKAFYTLWTLKESYLKLLGRGLTKALNTFSVVEGNNGFVIKENGESLHDVFLKTCTIELHHICSVSALEDTQHIEPTQINILELEEILNNG